MDLIFPIALFRQLDSFRDYWLERECTYGKQLPDAVQFDDAAAEFGRHTLELFQDCRFSELDFVVDRLELEHSTSDEIGQASIEQLIRVSAADWWDSGVGREALVAILPVSLKSFAQA